MLRWLILNSNQTLQVNFLAYYNNLVSQVRDLRPWNFWKYFSVTNEVYWWNRSHFWWWVLLNCAPTSTQLHPPPPSSSQPLTSSINLHPAHFSLHPALCNTLNNIWTKILHVIGQFPPNLGRQIKSYPFWLKIGTHGILEGFISTKSRLWFLKFQPQNSFLSKFGSKNSKVFVLSENWCSQYLKDAVSKSGLGILKCRSQNPFLGKFWSKKSKLFVFPENWHAWHLDNADSYSNISFLNCQP